MNVLSLSEIRKNLKHLSDEELCVILTKLAKFKKVNKEYVSFLLLNESNEDLYVEEVKEHLLELLENLNQSSIQYAKKTLRKVLKILRQCAAFSEKDVTQLDLSIFFCHELNKLQRSIRNHSIVQGMYNREITRMDKVLKAMHEDLVSDYQIEWTNLKLRATHMDIKG
jgi:membrane-anchored protein YejM (alkaline phosphatase superfamily)